MDNYVTRNSQLSTQSSSPQASFATEYEPYHHARSKRAAIAMAERPLYEDPTYFSPRESVETSFGVELDIDWDSLATTKGVALQRELVQRQVKSNAQLAGRRRIATIWKYSVELEYQGDFNLKACVLFLCRKCYI